MIELATRREPAPITERQREVVTLIAAGCSNEEVGARLWDLPQDRQGALRRAAAEARREAQAADPDRLPASDRRRSACLGTPLAAGARPHR